MLTEEMKTQRLDDAIAVMQRVVDNEWYFDMGDFYTAYPNHVRDSPPYGHAKAPLDTICGTAACFAGYIAASPEFIKNGWYVIRGVPLLIGCNDTYVDSAVAQYFGWSQSFSELLCWLQIKRFNELYDTSSPYDVSPEMVLNVLLEIKAGNLDPTE